MFLKMNSKHFFQPSEQELIYGPLGHPWSKMTACILQWLSIFSQVNLKVTLSDLDKKHHYIYFIRKSEKSYPPNLYQYY